MNYISYFGETANDIQGRGFRLLKRQRPIVVQQILEAKLTEWHDQKITVTSSVLAVIQNLHDVIVGAIGQICSNFHLTVSSFPSRNLETLYRNGAPFACASENFSKSACGTKRFGVVKGPFIAFQLDRLHTCPKTSKVR